MDYGKVEQKKTKHHHSTWDYSCFSIRFLYGEETITGRKIGNIYATSEIMGEYFGREGSVDAELYLEWTE